MTDKDVTDAEQAVYDWAHSATGTPAEEAAKHKAMDPHVQVLKKARGK
jgi:hypothetical protein